MNLEINVKGLLHVDATAGVTKVHFNNYAKVLYWIFVELCESCAVNASLGSLDNVNIFT